MRPERWGQSGIQTVLSLLTQEEESELGILDEAVEAANARVEIHLLSDS